jgi:hypothetical protein
VVGNGKAIKENLKEKSEGGLIKCLLPKFLIHVYNKGEDKILLWHKKQ